MRWPMVWAEGAGGGRGDWAISWSESLSSTGGAVVTETGGVGGALAGAGGGGVTGGGTGAGAVATGAEGDGEMEATGVGGAGEGAGGGVDGLASGTGAAAAAEADLGADGAGLLTAAAFVPSKPLLSGP